MAAAGMAIDVDQSDWGALQAPLADKAGSHKGARRKRQRDTHPDALDSEHDARTRSNGRRKKMGPRTHTLERESGSSVPRPTVAHDDYRRELRLTDRAATMVAEEPVGPLVRRVFDPAHDEECDRLRAQIRSLEAELPCKLRDAARYDLEDQIGKLVRRLRRLEGRNRS